MKVTTEMHFIRKHIMRVLFRTKWARFRDMRPERVDSNLYNYHLKQLLREGYIEHHPDKGYRLSPLGLRVVDHVSIDTFNPRWQPKIVTMTMTMNDNHEILMWPKYKQPFINTWSLPSGKMHYEDASIEAAERRELQYLTHDNVSELDYAGQVLFRARIHGELVSHTFCHIFRADLRGCTLINDRVQWLPLDDLAGMKLSPGTYEIIRDVLSHEGYFFAEYDIEW